MNLKQALRVPTLLAALAGFCLNLTAAESVINITEIGAGKRAVPVALSGFTGEAEATLKFDLYVAGFEFVDSSSAQYIIKGTNSEGRFEGRVIDRISNQQRVGLQYSTGTTRLQAHAFANAVVEEILKVKGIALTKIAYKGKTGRHTEIFVSDYDGHNSVQVTRDNSICAAPTWAPNQLKLYYTSYRGGTPDLYSHDLTSGQRNTIASYPGLNTSASISPDGRRIAMILSKGGSPDVYVADADGSNPIRLTNTKEEEASPCWSPDGKTLCFVSAMRGRPALYTMPASGGAPKQLKTIGVGTVTEPSWSPDGKMIALTATRRGGFDICVVPAEGGVAEPLVAGEDPSWAPNSRTIIFTRRAGGRRVLSLLDVPTKHVKDVAQNLSQCSQPSWAR